MEKWVEKRNISLSELCFYLFFVSLLFAKGIGLYDGQVSFKIFLLLALAGWVGKMILTQYELYEIPLYILLVTLGGMIYLVSREKGALLVILLLCAFKNMDLKKVFQVGCVTWILSFGSLFLLTSLHIVDSAFKVHDRLGLGRVIRWSLGYAHPNVLHISYFTLVCFLIFLLQDKYRFYQLVLLELGNFYVFLYSLSNTGFLVTTFCLVLVFYWNFRKKFCKVEKFLIECFLPVCLFFSFGAPLLLKGRTFDIVNKLLNTRVELSRWFLLNQQIKLFGVNTASIVTPLRTMDNSYVFAVITYGAIFFVFIMIKYFQIIHSTAKNQNGIALCIILSCLVAGLTEPFLFNTSFKNISLFFLGTELFAVQKMKRFHPIQLLRDRDMTILLFNFRKISKEIGRNFCRRRYQVTVATIIGALLCGVIVFLVSPMPENYFLPRSAFEFTDDLEQSYYFASEDDGQHEGAKVLGYQSDQTEMVLFSGRISQVERFRNTVTGVLISGVVIFVIGNMFMIRVGRKKKNYEK